ncbi:MAG: pyridoxal-phosphate dependent enzyme [Acidimicrobiia bacterium]|nr:pyridoxal-phosphate dependent enzyme [Acidimicrobiia bacterium]
MGSDVDVDAIRAARQVIEGVAKHTPVVASAALADRWADGTHREIVLKAENLQRTGSFKIRGAVNKVASLGERGAAGVTTGSAGNHAQALAFAARHFDVPCQIYVPVGAPITKIEACRAYGATVDEIGHSLTEAVAAARTRADSDGMTFCSPYDDPAVVAGQGTLGLEVLEDVPDVSSIVIPLGGGGLASGVAIAVKSQRPDVRVIGVQAAVCAPYAGAEVPEGPVLTLADGIAVKRPGEVTGPLVERWIDEIVTVGENAIADAMVLLMDRSKLYAEGAGAVGVAAVMCGAVEPAVSGTTCIVVSGGNVDLGVVPGLIRRHENEAGRRLAVFARIDDRPGGLAALLSVFAEGGADLIEVDHIREGLDLHVRETGINATFAVRSAAHGDLIMRNVREAGFGIELGLSARPPR